MFASLLLFAATAAAGQAADPLAPAREGKYQCVVPNQEKKTCAGTTRYKLGPNGAYDATTQLFLATTPLITMEIRTNGTVKDGQTCETIKLAEFENGTVMLNGQPADAPTATAVKSQMTAAVQALDGKTACSVFKPDADGMMRNEVSIDGAARPDLSQKFIWVSEKDGYSLGM